MAYRVRTYGTRPSTIAILHGGPGGAGEVEPLAQALGQRGHAVLEPFQTAHSIAGQVTELKGQIEHFCVPPIVVIGWSWGAWLGCLFASQHAALVRKLIIIGSGPLTDPYAAKIKATKNARLSKEQQNTLNSLPLSSKDPSVISRFIELNDTADTYEGDVSLQPDVFYDAEIHSAV